MFSLNFAKLASLVQNDLIYRLTNFIEINFDRYINVEELEAVAFYSYRNLQRIFKYSTGETIGSFQKRIKLEKAYKLILYSQKSISEIALEVNFENLASFSKAFKQQFGISPKEAKVNKLELFKSNTTIQEVSKDYLTPEILFIPETKIYYQSKITNYENEDIEALWNEFFHYVFPENQTEYYGIIADEPLITDKIKCRYDAGCNVQSISKELPCKKILGKKYAKFIHQGSYETIQSTYHNIYTHWILKDNLEFDSSPIIEHYVKHDDNTASSSEFVTFILIPLL